MASAMLEAQGKLSVLLDVMAPESNSYDTMRAHAIDCMSHHLYFLIKYVSQAWRDEKVKRGRQEAYWTTTEERSLNSVDIKPQLNLLSSGRKLSVYFHGDIADSGVWSLRI